MTRGTSHHDWRSGELFRDAVAKKFGTEGLTVDCYYSDFIAIFIVQLPTRFVVHFLNVF